MIDPNVQLVAQLLEHQLGDSSAHRGLFGSRSLHVKIVSDGFKRTITLKDPFDSPHTFEIDQIIDGIKLFENGRTMSINQKNKLTNYVTELYTELNKNTLSTVWCSLNGRFSKLDSILADLEKKDTI